MKNWIAVGAVVQILPSPETGISTTGKWYIFPTGIQIQLIQMTSRYQEMQIIKGQINVLSLLCPSTFLCRHKWGQEIRSQSGNSGKQKKILPLPGIKSWLSSLCPVTLHYNKLAPLKLRNLKNCNISNWMAQKTSTLENNLNSRYKVWDHQRAVTLQKCLL